MITLLLSLLLAHPTDLATARAQALRCATETAWAERVEGGWLAICGDASGLPRLVVR